MGFCAKSEKQLQPTESKLSVPHINESLSAVGSYAERCGISRFVVLTDEAVTPIGSMTLSGSI